MPSGAVSDIMSSYPEPPLKNHSQSSLEKQREEPWTNDSSTLRFFKQDSWYTELYKPLFTKYRKHLSIGNPFVIIDC